MSYMPLEAVEHELTLMRSRFVARLAPVITIDEAKKFVARIKKQYSGASHNVPAFTVGEPDSCTDFCSDDGEPSGTSGKPLLAVLKGSGFINTAIVVTRYFGGTLLGTGGLVKAYSEAGRLVLQQAKKARRIQDRRVVCAMPYRYFERVKRSCDALRVSIHSADFAEEARVTMDVELSYYDEWRAATLSAANGELHIEDGGLIYRMQALPEN